MENQHTNDGAKKLRAIKKNVMEINTPASPSAGSSVPADKLNPKGEGERFEYRFGTSNDVPCAVEVKNAARKAADQQAENTVNHGNSGADCDE